MDKYSTGYGKVGDSEKFRVDMLLIYWLQAFEISRHKTLDLCYLIQFLYSFSKFCPGGLCNCFILIQKTANNS